VPMTTVASLWQHRRSIAELPVKANCFIVPNRITFSSAAERHIEQGDSFSSAAGWNPSVFVLLPAVQICRSFCTSVLRRFQANQSPL
jgi:hypothetical protein